MRWGRVRGRGEAGAVVLDARRRHVDGWFLCCEDEFDECPKSPALMKYPEKSRKLIERKEEEECGLRVAVSPKGSLRRGRGGLTDH